MVGNTPFELKIWNDEVASAIKGKPKGTMVAVKGRICRNMNYKSDEFMNMYLTAEKITLIEKEV